MALNGKKNVKKFIKDAPKSQKYQNIKRNSELLKTAKQRAHSIVLSLLDVKISKEYLQQNIIYLTQENFDDVAIERTLIGLCGYALCDQPTSYDEKFKNQTYIIRNNKVYDITKRKNFCSNKCYQAFEILYLQIPTAPLYIRSEDKEVQNLKIIVPVLDNLKGKYGMRVDITGTSFDTDLELDDIEETSEINTDERLSPAPLEKDLETFTTAPSSPIPNYEEDSTAIVPDQEENGIMHSKENNKTLNQSLNNNPNKNKPSSNGVPQSSEEEIKLANEVQTLSLNLDNDVQNESIRSVEKESLRDTTTSSPKSKQKTTNESFKNDVLEIEHVLREWMTFESLRIILGNVYVKGMLEHLGEIWEHYDRSSDLQFPRLDMKAKYIALCKKLNKDEMKERLQDAQMEVEEEEGLNRESRKPIPDYERLQKDVERSSLKVKAFYEGTDQYVQKKEILEVIKEENEDYTDDSNKPTKKIKTYSKAKKEKEEEEEKVITLPLIDQYSQKAWRRQIVFEKLSKKLAEFSIDFGLDEGEIRKLVINLIETFDLTARNICFKTSQWKFVALVIIKMLSVRYPIIAKVFLPSEKTFDLVATYLRTVGLDEGYLDRLLSYITDVSYILAKTEKIVNLESNFEDARCTVKRNEISKKEQGKFLKEVLPPSTDQEELD